MRAVTLAFVAAFLVASPALAGPVYLECSVTDGKASESFSVALDEAARQVTHTMANGFVITRPATFTADRVYYENVLDITRLGDAWSIDRTTLAVQRLNVVHDSSTVAMSGACKIASTKGRKI